MKRSRRLAERFIVRKLKQWKNEESKDLEHPRSR